MLPILESIGDGQDRSNQEVASIIAKKLALTDQELQQMLPSGNQKVFINRLAWAKAHLKKAKLVESPARGMLQITPKGKDVLASPPSKINLQFLRGFPSYDWHAKPKVPHETNNDEERTPEEVLEDSFQALNEKLAEELLERLKACSPAFFEKLVVDLLVAMGYGGSHADVVQAVGHAGDGGVDGIIKEDALGLDAVYIQAKRWERTVGRPEVQAFAGSMEGVRGKKGVMLTTATFSKEAEEYVTRIERKIVLVDGPKLAHLMIKHNIGVTTARSYDVKKLDLDYFDEEDA